jgi:hypothetical protein
MPADRPKLLGIDFDLLGEISNIQRIASGRGVRIRHHLNRKYAGGRRVDWLKRKGVAVIQWRDTSKVEKAELHWVEASGIGRVRISYKRSIL